HLIRTIQYGEGIDGSIIAGVSSSLMLKIRSWIARELIKANLLGQYLMLRRPRRLIVVPGRMISSRAASFYARRLNIPSIDIQSVFITNHPRYYPSLCDRYFAISTDQLDIYRMNHPPKDQELHVAGS